MVDAEEYFPRGGKKPTIQYFKQSGNFLAPTEKGERKKRKPKKKVEGDDGYLSDEAAKEVDLSYKHCATGLSYKVAKPGTLILGRVRQIQETKVKVMLPSKMNGTVMACHVSEPYNKLLEDYVNDKVKSVRDLKDMFRMGQYVATKVLEVSGSHLMLSLMPQDVNGCKSHGDLHKGCVLQAAVASIEDHGYVMDIGIKNTRAFLPKDSINPEVQLEIGVLAWCVVKTLTPSAENSVVSLSNQLEHLQAGFLKRGQTTALLPATAVDFRVEKPLENGIEGHVFKEVTAYIQRQHADSVKGKKPTLGQKVRARVLYVMPVRNTPFLLMRDIFATTYPDLESEQKFKEGDIIDDAQVMKIAGRSIHFKLGKGSVGTMSLKRIQVDEDLRDEEVVAKSYPIGSKHKVRVLLYNMSDYSYSISDQPSVLRERYFSLAQLSVGAVVSATVAAPADQHLAVTVGRLAGIVPKSHLSDAGVYVDPKKASNSKLTKKFKVGQEVRARVWALDLVKQSLILTLKPSLLEPELVVLASYEAAEVGRAYTGVIRHIRDYLLVSFFDNVVAFVPRHFVSVQPIDNLFDAFHVGQIVSCTILNVNVAAKKMSGSLLTKPPPRKKTDRPDKRKQISDDDDEVPSKKQKSDEEDTDTKPKKKKDKKKEQNDDENEMENTKEHKKKKDKKAEHVSEESDGIKTDIHEEILTPQDLGLLDLSDCVTHKQFKKRVVSILKAIKARLRRVDTIDKKILKIEEKGLNAKNKMFHTAMHTEKLVIEERVKKLMEGLNIAQSKLKQFVEETIDNGEEENAEDGDGKRREEIESEERPKKKARKEVKVVDSLEPVLDVPSAKEFWTSNADSLAKAVEEESSSSEDEEQEQPKKKRKKLTVAEKLAKVRDEEERVREMERRAIDSESQPRSSEQFERALLANPNCSQLWIAYMAFHLQATEMEKARAVCRKALGAISFREEAERLNVWLALLNCEHRFGTKETQQKTLEEALQMNDTFKIHSKLLDILVETGKHQELSTLVDLMQRKYKRDPATYSLCGAACYRAGLVDKARQVMQKAVAVLEKKEHVSILVQFALLERSAGAAERAEALCEQVLAVYPARVDVCATYVDMLLKSRDLDAARQVMERMTSQKLPARKMKVLYKKWIEIEEKFGDQAQVDLIKQRAVEYIDKAKF